MKFIIEHLEDKIYPWCVIEYKNISNFIGKNNLIFTNVKKSEAKKLKNFGEVKTESVKNLNLKKSCLLDPNAEKELTPNDKFDYYIFGGILGDYPPRKRTNKLLNLKTEKRNLTKEQMPTDIAVIATKMVIDGKNLKDFKFKDKLKIEIKSGKYREEIELPYRYLIINNKPFISKELIEYLKKKKSI